MSRSLEVACRQFVGVANVVFRKCTTNVLTEMHHFSKRMYIRIKKCVLIFLIYYVLYYIRVENVFYIYCAVICLYLLAVGQLIDRPIHAQSHKSAAFLLKICFRTQSFHYGPQSIVSHAQRQHDVIEHDGIETKCKKLFHSDKIYKKYLLLRDLFAAYLFSTTLLNVFSFQFAPILLPGDSHPFWKSVTPFT